jgi:hypothetical protein
VKQSGNIMVLQIQTLNYKVHLITGHEGPEVEYRYSSTLSLTSAIDGDGWSTPRPGRFIPGKDPVPIVQEAGWTPGSVWTGAENLAPPPRTGLRSPERPARSESLYRLSYPGSRCEVNTLFMFRINDLCEDGHLLGCDNV